MKFRPLGLATLTVLVLVSAPVSMAQSPLHPDVALLDEAGEPVIASGRPVSAARSCGECHDTGYIASHSYHVAAGLDEIGSSRGHSWDHGPGLLGRWDPITYRRLSGADESPPDLGLADWVRTFGALHVGGGAALGPSEETASLAGGDWDWEASGGVEMNCFLCHIPQPANAERIRALETGRFRWATTATLDGTGMVERNGDGWRYVREAFEPDGTVRQSQLKIVDPTAANCGLCHKQVWLSNEPLVVELGRARRSSDASGLIFSAQRIRDSALNLAGKENLPYAWDVHADRLLECTDCHHALNNPVRFSEADRSRPRHLAYDARRLEIGEYLRTPNHNFTKGESAQGHVARRLDGSMRRCEGCHNAEATHSEWLQNPRWHLRQLLCESCHIPQVLAPARRQTDWTVLREDGSPLVEYRGIEGDPADFATEISGFAPAMLARNQRDGEVRHGPHNLVTSWFWVAGDPERPVPLETLRSALLDGEGAHHLDVVEALDGNGDGVLTPDELRLDSEAKVAAVRSRLEAAGVEAPRIIGSVQPISLHHGVVEGRYARRSCEDCHSTSSTMARSIVLSSYQPSGAEIELVGDTNVELHGERVTDDAGRLLFVPEPSASGRYVIGLARAGWIDIIGLLMFAGVVVGTSIHGGLRWYEGRKRPASEHHRYTRVKLYTGHERIWHWIQAAAIVFLILTGLEMRDSIGLFGFEPSVRLHNALGFFLLFNAFLGLFYYVTSGAIRHYISEPREFGMIAMRQVGYYVSGIFKGAPHPVERSARARLNPLQQVTYVAILNVLLPWQILTGFAIWGIEYYPHLGEWFGGLPVLMPLHALGSWLFASFILMHVYLTTTSGRRPTSGIEAMVTGWEEMPDEGDPSTHEEISA